MEASDLHGGPVGEALVPSQEPGRADGVVPEGYDRLCAGAVTVSSRGLERPWQHGATAEGNAQQSSSSGPAASELAPLGGVGGDRSWGGTARAPLETSAGEPWGQRHSGDGSERREPKFSASGLRGIGGRTRKKWRTS